MTQYKQIASFVNKEIQWNTNT